MAYKLGLLLSMLFLAQLFVFARRSECNGG